MQKKLAFDLDDVLFPFVKEFIGFANNRFGTTKSVKDITTYSLDKAFKIPFTDVILAINDFMLDSEIRYAQPLDYENATKALLQLKERYELHIVTARLDVYSETTNDWINLYFPEIFTGIHHCSFLSIMPTHITKISKADKCKEIGSTWLIDDSPSNISDCYIAGINTILFGDFAWHKELSKKIVTNRTSSWNDVIKIIEGKNND